MNLTQHEFHDLRYIFFHIIYTLYFVFTSFLFLFIVVCILSVLLIAKRYHQTKKDVIRGAWPEEAMHEKLCGQDVVRKSVMRATGSCPEEKSAPIKARSKV